MNDASNIFNYLPIRRNTPENDYINHLWRVFSTLGEQKDTARPFAGMPFHLLFMLSVQYKMLQILPIYKQATDLFFTGVGGRNKEQLLSEKRSVFDMAFINERTIPDIFQLIEIDIEIIKKFKELVDERNNNLAHAKGGIEIDLESKIGSYLSILESIQKKCKQINYVVAENLLSEIVDGDDVGEFFESRLLRYWLNPCDIGDIVGKMIESEKLDYEQWEQVVNKGKDLAYTQTIIALSELKVDRLDDRKKSEVGRILKENGEPIEGY